MTNPLNTVISCENVSKIVDTQEGSLTILNDISFKIGEQNSAVTQPTTAQATQAESVAIIGQSGSGKTTLLSLLAGLDTPNIGSVQLFGTRLELLSEDQRADLRNQYIGFVFQSFHLIPGFSALENVMLPLEINRHENAEAQAITLLERVGIAHRLHHYPNTLSGGEQQRVAIARAFATKPPILFADEPTGNLDTATGLHIMDLLFELNSEQNTTLVLVTHDPVLAERCSRQLTLSQGNLERES